ncbi:hypothetical protein JQX29_19725 [Sulfitobacter pseudonitzschiae]|uniref:Lipoprotein n=2 Tax=Pseudosulfitobacter pseudonitzschiae TaxID=1402135 RepID=A0A9Q2NX56_9RHOB|nr:hypothetical protein [Pseudosulfitobacter pseudonitzschiae]MBM2356798.1 hypothetical protein [Pseudosulfitobacter pseudonitzschiae]MBM2390486.1 hypothetical protein [Pseudosulfitobacter pseudonitzschiae]
MSDGRQLGECQIRKLLALAGALAFTFGCSVPKTEAPECLAPIELTQALSQATEKRSVWEEIFREIPDDYDVPGFLADWRPGDSYNILDMTCFEYPTEVPEFVAEITTPRLGNALLGFTREGGKIVARNFFADGLSTPIE